mmetsp:Transcript_155253/g.498105  ORF Transcript_155253/g.498105 Transcript_155253/m.498105 type:complete len:156 (-) Transcript_155253:3643-4110(-)
MNANVPPAEPSELCQDPGSAGRIAPDQGIGLLGAPPEAEAEGRGWTPGNFSREAAGGATAGGSFCTVEGAPIAEAAPSAAPSAAPTAREAFNKPPARHLLITPLPALLGGSFWAVVSLELLLELVVFDASDVGEQPTAGNGANGLGAANRRPAPC